MIDIIEAGRASTRDNNRKTKQDQKNVTVVKHLVVSSSETDGYQKKELSASMRENGRREIRSGQIGPRRPC